MQWLVWLVIAVAATVALYAAFVCWLLLVGRRADARAFASFVPDCIVLVSRLAREPRVPRRRKALLFAVVGYLAMPFDVVPDFIPVAGQLDDVIVVALVLRHVIRAGGEPLIRELWPGPSARWRCCFGLRDLRPLRPETSRVSNRLTRTPRSARTRVGGQAVSRARHPGGTSARR